MSFISDVFKKLQVSYECVSLWLKCWGKREKFACLKEKMCVQMFLTQAAAIYKNLFERESKNKILKKVLNVRFVSRRILVPTFGCCVNMETSKTKCAC